MSKFEICSRLHNFGFRNGRPSMGILAGDVDRVQDQSASLHDCQSFIQEKYFQHCSRSDAFQSNTLRIGTIMLSKLSLIIQCPLFRNSTVEAISIDLRNLLFDLSCEIITSSHDLIQDEQTAPWSWLLQTYVHWHPVAYLLSEICTGLPENKMRRAWNMVNMATKEFHGLSPKGIQNLWHPLRSLFERARSSTPQLSLATMTQAPSNPDFGKTDLETTAFSNQEDFFDADMYGMILGEDSMQDNEREISIWNWNDSIVQNTFDPTWWS